MNNTLRQVRILHAVFVATWFMFLYVANFVLPPSSLAATLPSFFPLVVAVVVISEIGMALFLRARFIGSAEMMLRVNSEDRAAIAKWRTGNLFSFCIAETVTLFGLIQKVLGFDWKVAGIFFGVGLLLLILWTPRKLQAMPRGVR